MNEFGMVLVNDHFKEFTKTVCIRKNQEKNKI